MIRAPADVTVRCTDLVSSARDALVNAESYRPTTFANMQQRWAYLSTLINLPDPEVKDPSVDPSGRWGFLANCTRPAIDRFTIYFEWNDILADQANAALIAEDKKCSEWTDAIIHYKIATHAANVAQLISRFGNHNADVAHLEALLRTWARENRMHLPALTSERNAARFQSTYGRLYDEALVAATGRC